MDKAKLQHRRELEAASFKSSAAEMAETIAGKWPEVEGEIKSKRSYHATTLVNVAGRLVQASVVIHFGIPE